MAKNERYWFKTIDDGFGGKITIQVCPEFDRPKLLRSFKERFNLH